MEALRLCRAFSRRVEVYCFNTAETVRTKTSKFHKSPARIQLVIAWRRTHGVVLVYTRLSVSENTACHDSLGWKAQSVREKAYQLSPHFMPCSWQLWAPHLKMQPSSWAEPNSAEKQSSTRLPAFITLFFLLFRRSIFTKVQPLSCSLWGLWCICCCQRQSPEAEITSSIPATDDTHTHRERDAGQDRHHHFSFAGFGCAR